MDALFERHISHDGDCWIWTGCSLPSGYGKLRRFGRDYLAHRYSYEIHCGPIPEGMQIDHLCRNTRCVNPAHLEAVTGRENVLRGNTAPSVNAAKSHCKNGHPLDDAYRYGRKRLCRICRAAAEQRRRERLKRITGVTYLRH